MYSLILFGVGELIGGASMGYIVDKIGSKLSTLVDALFVGLAGICVFIYITINKFSWLAYLMALLWGI